jgi:hypothetical protein
MQSTLAVNSLAGHGSALPRLAEFLAAFRRALWFALAALAA